MSLQHLTSLLEQRLQVISDHELRAQNPEEQLRQLRTVSEAIVAAHAALRTEIDPRLHHYLTQASYSKALDHLKGETKNGGGH